MYKLYMSSAKLHLDDLASAGCLSVFQSKQRAHFEEQPSRLQHRRAAEKRAVFLVAKCGFTERAKQRTTPLTREEEVARMEAGWKHWDFLISAIGSDDRARLADLVCVTLGAPWPRQTE